MMNRNQTNTNRLPNFGRSNEVIVLAKQTNHNPQPPQKLPAFIADYSIVINVQPDTKKQDQKTQGGNPLTQFLTPEWFLCLTDCSASSAQTMNAKSACEGDIILVSLSSDIDEPLDIFTSVCLIGVLKDGNGKPYFCCVSYGNTMDFQLPPTGKTEELKVSLHDLRDSIVKKYAEKKYCIPEEMQLVAGQVLVVVNIEVASEAQKFLCYLVKCDLGNTHS